MPGTLPTQGSPPAGIGRTQTSASIGLAALSAGTASAPQAHHLGDERFVKRDGTGSHSVQLGLGVDRECQEDTIRTVRTNGDVVRFHRPAQGVTSLRYLCAHDQSGLRRHRQVSSHHGCYAASVRTGGVDYGSDGKRLASKQCHRGDAIGLPPDGDHLAVRSREDAAARVADRLHQATSQRGRINPGFP